MQLPYSNHYNKTNVTGLLQYLIWIFTLTSPTQNFYEIQSAAELSNMI